LAYCVLALRANYFVPYKEDYKQALAYVAHDYRRSDCAVVAPRWEERQAQWAWSIYEGNQPFPQMVALDSVASVSRECERVWLISVMYKQTPPAIKEAERARHTLVQAYPESARKRFFWVDIDLFARHEKDHARPGMVGVGGEESF
jgi:hypothetical protein